MPLCRVGLNTPLCKTASNWVLIFLCPVLWQIIYTRSRWKQSGGCGARNKSLSLCARQWWGGYSFSRVLRSLCTDETSRAERAEVGNEVHPRELKCADLYRTGKNSSIAWNNVKWSLFPPHPTSSTQGDLHGYLKLLNLSLSSAQCLLLLPPQNLN